MITNRNTRAVRRSSRRDKPLVIFGVGLFLLLILLFSFFPMTRNTEDDEYIKQLEARLSSIENRLDQLEPALASLVGENNPGGRYETLNTTCQRLEASLTLKSNLLAGRLDSLETRVREIGKTAAAKPVDKKPVKKKQVSKKIESKEAVPSKQSPRYHVVEKGDTAYSISRRYDLSLKKLKELNRFTEKTTIYPGQKILVAP